MQTRRGAISLDVVARFSRRGALGPFILKLERGCVGDSLGSDCSIFGNVDAASKVFIEIFQNIMNLPPSRLCEV